MALTMIRTPSFPPSLYKCSLASSLSVRSSMAPSVSPRCPQLLPRTYNTHRPRISCWKRWGGGVGIGKEVPPPPSPKTPGGGDPVRSPPGTFLERFLATKPMPPRNTPRWYAEMALICTVFGITGSSTMFLVRPAVSDVLGLEGSFRDGPWSYRVCSLVIMTPTYASLLVAVGTVFGRHAYFRHFSVKMFSRFGIPPELMDRNFHKNAKKFRKW